jgi:chromosome segregation ATPase
MISSHLCSNSTQDEHFSCRARILDMNIAASIKAAADACILRNNNNSEVARLSRLVSRRNHQARRRSDHHAIDDSMDDVQAQIVTTSQAQKELKAKLKDLTEKKKEAGRTPRHNRAAAHKFDSVRIPAICGLTPILGSESYAEIPSFGRNADFGTEHKD